MLWDTRPSDGRRCLCCCCCCWASPSGYCADGRSATVSEAWDQRSISSKINLRTGFIICSHLRAPPYHAIDELLYSVVVRSSGVVGTYEVGNGVTIWCKVAHFICRYLSLFVFCFGLPLRILTVATCTFYNCVMQKYITQL